MVTLESSNYDTHSESHRHMLARMSNIHTHVHTLSYANIRESQNTYSKDKNIGYDSDMYSDEKMMKYTEIES